MDIFVIRKVNSENKESTQKRKNKETTGQELNKKVREDFDPNWSRVYPWLEKSEDSNGKVIMFCSWCKNAKKKNVFTIIPKANT